MTGKFDIHFLWERCACGADTITSLLGCNLGAQEVPGPHDMCTLRRQTPLAHMCTLRRQTPLGPRSDRRIEVKEQQTEANENARND